MPETVVPAQQTLEIPPPRTFEIIKKPSTRRARRAEVMHFSILTPKEGVVIPNHDVDAPQEDAVAEEEKKGGKK